MSHNEDFPIISFVGNRIKFWLYSQRDPFIGDCVSIFLSHETRKYYLGINFDGESDVVGVDLIDIKMVRKLKKITKNYSVIHVSEIKEKTDNGSS